MGANRFEVGDLIPPDRSLRVLETGAAPTSVGSPLVPDATPALVGLGVAFGTPMDDPAASNP